MITRSHTVVYNWADVDVDHRTGKTSTATRIDEVITGSPAAKYSHDHPVEGLVRGDNIVELGGVKIQDLALSITTGWINEADKLNIIDCLSIDPFKAIVKTREQGELVIQASIHQYLHKLCHDCGHPSATKIVDILMQGGCSDYALDVAKRYLDFTEHVTLPILRIRCRWCDEEGHVETEADAELRTEAPAPYGEDNVEADQDPESAEHESTGKHSAPYHTS